MSDAAGAAPSGSDVGGGASSAGTSGGFAGGTTAPDTVGSAGASSQALPGDHAREENAAADKSAAAKGKPEPVKFKTKRGGKEIEYDTETAAKMLSDDHEWEFPGPKGAVEKRKWADITRAVQKDAGALASMQRYNEMIAKHEQEIEWGQKNPDKFIEARLGIKDVDQWAYDRATKVFQERQRMAELATQNPQEHQRILEERAREKFERGQALERDMTQRQQQQQAQQQAVQRQTTAIQGALKDGGVAVNNITMQLARDVCKRYNDAGAGDMLTAELVHSETRAAYEQMVREFFGAMDVEKHLDWLGEDTRAKFREAEVARARGRKKEERAAAPAPAAAQQRGTPAGAMTAADFSRKYGGGGGISS